jgi:hypothetical protein
MVSDSLILASRSVLIMFKLVIGFRFNAKGAPNNTAIGLVDVNSDGRSDVVYVDNDVSTDICISN